jgi:hypothetical protein
MAIARICRAALALLSMAMTIHNAFSQLLE